MAPSKVGAPKPARPGSGKGVSLFSRAVVPRPSSQKKVRGFLGLPGELRNCVYHFYYEEDFFAEIAAKLVTLSEKRQPIIKLCVGTVYRGTDTYKPVEPKAGPQPRCVRSATRLGQYNCADGGKTDWKTSLSALHLVCKQIHGETRPFLYSNTTFVFNAPRRIDSFFRVVPRKNLTLITKLHLHCMTYGEPRKNNDRKWVDMFQAAWDKACKTASKQLINLKELSIWLGVKETGIWMDLQQRWCHPFYNFRRLTRPRKIKMGEIEVEQPGPLWKIDIDFTSHLTSSNCFFSSQLFDACADLHHLYGVAISRRIMGMSEKEAMAEWHEAWNGKYAQHRIYLNFNKTGW